MSQTLCVPPLVPVSVIAKATGWSLYVARSTVRRAGILQRDGRRWAAPRGLLMERLEDVYRDVFEYYAARRQRKTRRVSASFGEGPGRS